VQEDEKLLEGVVLAHPKEVSLEPYTTPVPSYAFSSCPLSQPLPLTSSPLVRTTQCRKSEADLPNMARFIDNKRSLFVSAQAKQTEKEKCVIQRALVRTRLQALAERTKPVCVCDASSLRL
jgi:hypothetical protein